MPWNLQVSIYSILALCSSSFLEFAVSLRPRVSCLKMGADVHRDHMLVANNGIESSPECAPPEHSRELDGIRRDHWLQALAARKPHTQRFFASCPARIGGQP